MTQQEKSYIVRVRPDIVLLGKVDPVEGTGYCAHAMWGVSHFCNTKAEAELWLRTTWREMQDRVAHSM